MKTEPDRPVPPERAVIASPERALLAPLIALTGVTGVVDAASFLGMGRIFTANMTGNVVFLGFALAGAPGMSVARCTTALVGFIVGAVLGGRLALAMRDSPRSRWIVSAFVAEAVLLLAAAAAAPAPGTPDPPAGPLTRMGAVIEMTALAMGIRNATVRALGIPDLTTTVLTLTITGLAADSTLAGGANPRWSRRIVSVLVMAAGAALGVVMLQRSLGLALLLSAVIVGLAAAFVHIQARRGRRAATP